ncbi:hypothetical protein FOL47_011278 [Perkinsus chesapeaki]|uniref:Uncharacterized protein n=1 Tax=Perkinsus chesapeaki TaxID=330153 RepID=A0A7J6MMM7_PERCH|nr:hypothetical protein FOL47_011278 [Perkinsus chesapeaki]
MRFDIITFASVATFLVAVNLSGCSSSSSSTTTTQVPPTSQPSPTTAAPTGPTTPRPTSTPGAPTPDGLYVFNGSISLIGGNASAEVQVTQSTRMIDRLIVATENPYKVVASSNGHVPFHMLDSGGVNKVVIDDPTNLPALFAGVIDQTTIQFFDANNSITISVPSLQIFVALGHRGARRQLLV